MTNSEDYEVTFHVNGCAWINEVSFTLNNDPKKVIASQGHCNQDIKNMGVQQSEFKVVVGSNDELSLHAIVDQEMGKSVIKNNVAPAAF